MGSVRFSIALCVVLIVGTVAAVPGAAAQENQTTLTVTVVDQDGNALSNIAISATWDDGDGGPVNETTRSNGQALIDVAEGKDIALRIDDDEYVLNNPQIVEDASGQSVEVAVSRAAEATVTVNEPDGTAVENARVRLQRSGKFITSQLTDADGTVRTPPIEEGEYRVIVTKDGYFRNTTRAMISGQTEVAMTAEQGSALLTVTVVDDHFDEPRPVQGVSVNIPSVGTLQSQSSGQVTTSVAVNTEYDLELSKEGYGTVEQTVQVRESDTEVQVAIQRDPQLNLAAGNARVVVGESVRLEVTDEYGDPVAGVTITQNDEEVGTTNDEGVANVPVPSEGNVSFMATSEDGLLATTTVEGVAPGEVEQTAAGTEEGDEFELPIGADGPGFTPVTALIAVALLAVFALRRR